MVLLRFIKVAILSLIIFSACTPAAEKEFNQANTESEKKNFREALSHYEKVIIREPNTQLGLKATREAARISFYEIKDFRKAAEFYKSLVLNSESSEERMIAQENIVSLYFDHLNDYEKSVIELNRLISMLTDFSDKAKFKMDLARAYYYQNNFAQAENEADEFLIQNPPDDQKYEMMMLKSNILIAKKELAKAAELLKTVLAKFPARAQKENVALTLAVSYEEMKDYKSAIATLQTMKATHPFPEYIDVRIKRIQERIKNQPGAKGMRK
jgi:tetratricopeptide (TPR) repeat protein